MELIAYLDDNREWEKSDIDAQNLTIINYAFADIVAGKVNRQLKKIHLINELKEENPHLRTCISIGGWTADGFSDAVLTEESRTVLIDSMLDYIEHYDFDGIDLDWEYPKMDIAGIKSRNEDSENLLLLLKSLRAQLNDLGNVNNRDYLLTIAVGAAPELLETTATSKGHKYAEYLDFINIMTYDMRGAFSHTTGHHTNLMSYSKKSPVSAELSVNYLMEKGIPSDKLVIGSAFYGRIWEGVKDSTNNGLMEDAEETGHKTMDYNALDSLTKMHPENCYFDDKARSAYYFDGNQFISYDSVQSITEKVRFVREYNLRGIMFWEYSLDLTRTLFDAMVRAKN